MFPTDRSGELRVEMDPIPDLFRKDTLELNARVIDAAGQPVSGGVVAFESSDGTVLNVLDATDGRFLAVNAGTAMVTAKAVGFADADSALASARVRGLIEVDSVVPRVVRFGDSLHVFGVGLNPDSLFSITLGSEDARPATFVPQDPGHPNRVGRLSLWVAPPTERFSTLTVVGTGGGLQFPDTVLVNQRDIYEPNDTVPWHLGDIDNALGNPALAFETRGRSDVTEAADWYTFSNTTQRDRTIIVFSEFVGAATFSVFMTDSLWWDQTNQEFAIGSASWTIGPETYLCDGQTVTRLGQPVTFNEQVFPFTIISLGDLPVGTYHVIVPYLALAEPRAYEMLIATGYFSSIPRDAAEENDYCDVAADLPAQGTQLTIDNPHDIDWYRFTVPGPLARNVSFTVSAGTSVSPNLPDPDLDLYVVRDFRPDSLVLVASATQEGNNETVSAVLPPDDYFLVVVDFPGSPTPYVLSSMFAAPPAALVAGSAAGAVRDRTDDGWATLQAKRAALRSRLEFAERLRNRAAPHR